MAMITGVTVFNEMTIGQGSTVFLLVVRHYMLNL